MATIIMYRENDGSIPFLVWLYKCPAKVQAKCRTRINRLKILGYELRRPEADYLRDGIYELRVGLQGINYRILYFFYSKEIIVISHGLIKEQLVPFKEIEKAIDRKKKYSASPDFHTYEEQDDV